LNAHLGPALGRVAFERVVKPLAGLGIPDEARAREGELQAAVHLAVLDKALQGREYLAGRLTIAEFALAPELSIATDCGIEMAEYPNVTRWLAQLTARPSLRSLRAQDKHGVAPSRGEARQVAV
jgi:glutathione S-transferase